MVRKKAQGWREVEEFKVPLPSPLLCTLCVSAALCVKSFSGVFRFQLFDRKRKDSGE
jgi:hypothetical protein